MRYVDSFRRGDAAQAFASRIASAGADLQEQGRSVALMEVCGSHTMAIARHGIRDLLPDNVRLVSGPGCPVCVTSEGYIDAAIALAEQGVLLASFGDMVRVPGSGGHTLALARSAGAEIHVVYSPREALDLAAANPERQVVFLAIGFETTTAPLAAVMHAVHTQQVANLSFLVSFKLVPPALEALVSDPEVQVDGFILPAHVSAIIGAEAYRPFVDRFQVPGVVAGFEPLDILMAVQELLEQLARNDADLVNQYRRVVRPEGNLQAQHIVSRYLEPADTQWRGLGTIPHSGLKLRQEYADLDAALRFGLSVEGGQPNKACRCGDVLKGKITPPECAIFNKACTPTNPLGPCMVSSEGSCAAWYKYVR